MRTQVFKNFFIFIIFNYFSMSVKEKRQRMNDDVIVIVFLSQT